MPWRRKRLSQWICIVAVGTAYLVTLKPGHVIAQDDFAAYIMHAANLVEGRPYTAIHYVANPQALWLAPTNGYPPVYPMLLAPAYKVWGMNLRAFKVVTVLCFVVFLVIFAALTEKEFRIPSDLAALFFVACNPVFWEQRDYVLSEFPYLMFSFGSLLVMERIYEDLELQELRIGTAVLLSLLLYASYGTRTIGIALLPAFVLADLAKFRRPSRFLLIVLTITGALILAQAIFLTSPTGYIKALELSAHTVARNTLFYSKVLSYAWANGISKSVQNVFALLFTALAAVGFLRRLWAARSAREFYLLGYLAILFVWAAEYGLRGLLPVLPLYFAYGLAEFGRVAAALSARTRTIAVALLLLFVAATYMGELRRASQQPPGPNVNDATAHELFSFLRTQTAPSEILIFSKPRTLALYTDRPVASLAPTELPDESYHFMKSVNATALVEAVWSPPAWEDLLANKKIQAVEIFRNSEYRVLRLTSNF